MFCSKLLESFENYSVYLDFSPKIKKHLFSPICYKTNKKDHDSVFSGTYDLNG